MRSSLCCSAWKVCLPWMLTGDWYPLGEMPEFVKYTGVAVLNFALLAEGGNAYLAEKGKQAILANPEHEKKIEAAGARRADAFRNRTGITGQ